MISSITSVKYVSGLVFMKGYTSWNCRVILYLWQKMLWGLTKQTKAGCRTLLIAFRRVRAENSCSCSCGTEARNNMKAVTVGETEAVSRKDHSKVQWSNNRQQFIQELHWISKLLVMNPWMIELSSMQLSSLPLTPKRPDQTFI